MHRFLSHSLLTSSLLLSYTTEAANNAEAELRRLRGETRENSGSQSQFLNRP